MIYIYANQLFINIKLLIIMNYKFYLYFFYFNKKTISSYNAREKIHTLDLITKIIINNNMINLGYG